MATSKEDILKAIEEMLAQLSEAGATGELK